MRNLIKVVIIVTFGFISLAVQADEAEIRKSLSQLTSPINPDSISATPIDGIYEIMVGPNIFYITGNGQYVIQGSILDVKNKTDLTELKRAVLRQKHVSEIDDAETVAFSPDEVKHKVYVFTDIDCGYCRKLHGEIDQYLALGIEIKYMLFPRAGVGSPSYDKAVTVWCSDDRATALTQSKQGVKLENKTCDNPVVKHLALGKTLGLSGTPMVVTDKGVVYPGYMPAQDLLERLEKDD